MRLIIGTPTYKRDWILPTWFEKIEQQDFPLSDVGFIFITAPNDHNTVASLLDFFQEHPEVRCFDIHEVQANHQSHVDGHRAWRSEQYHTMVDLRNTLLTKVRCYKPDKFFSLDSDILLENPQTISTLMELTDQYDAVSTLSYMTPESTAFPSVMTWCSESMERAYRPPYPIGTFFKADIIMASVMMSKAVYENVNYVWCKQGEDLGWSGNANKHGYNLYCASNIYTPHIMNTKQFQSYLTEGDSR